MVYSGLGGWNGSVGKSPGASQGMDAVSRAGGFPRAGTANEFRDSGYRPGSAIRSLSVQPVAKSLERAGADLRRDMPKRPDIPSIIPEATDFAYRIESSGRISSRSAGQRASPAGPRRRLS